MATNIDINDITYSIDFEMTGYLNANVNVDNNYIPKIENGNFVNSLIREDTEIGVLKELKYSFDSQIDQVVKGIIIKPNGTPTDFFVFEMRFADTGETIYKETINPNDLVGLVDNQYMFYLNNPVTINAGDKIFVRSKNISLLGGVALNFPDLTGDPTENYFFPYMKFLSVPANYQSLAIENKVVSKSGDTMTGNLGIKSIVNTNWSNDFAVMGLGNSYIASLSNGNSGFLTANNLYFDGTNWRYESDGAASFFSVSPSGYAIYTAPSGLANEIATVTEVAQIDNNGDVTANTFNGVALNNTGSSLEFLNGQGDYEKLFYKVLPLCTDCNNAIETGIYPINKFTDNLPSNTLQDWIEDGYLRVTATNSTSLIQEFISTDYDTSTNLVVPNCYRIHDGTHWSSWQRITTESYVNNLVSYKQNTTLLTDANTAINEGLYLVNDTTLNVPTDAFSQWVITGKLRVTSNSINNLVQELLITGREDSSSPVKPIYFRVKDGSTWSDWQN